MNKNSYRLVPGTINYWGDILGNIEQQKDLVEYISSHGGGKAEWGSISGNISDQSDLMETLSAYALLSDIPSLEGYATEIWVSEQGYLTSIPSEYATESWVESQGYLTSIPSEYATESWVNDTLSSYALSTDIPSLEGYATQSWVESQGYLTSIPSEYATESWVTSTVSIAVDTITSDLSSYATKQWIQNAYGTRSWVSNNFVSQEAMSSYATQSWVESQGYLTSIPSEYATESWVNETLSSYALSTDIPSLEGYATESWVESQGYLTSSALADGYAMKSDAELEPLYGRGSQTGYLKWDVSYEFTGSGSWISGGFFSDTYGARNVFNISGEAIGINYTSGSFYKYNRSTSEFEFLVEGYNYTQELTSGPLWVDPLGRVCIGYSYIVNLDPTNPSMGFGELSVWDHTSASDQWGRYAGGYYAVRNTGQHNIFTLGSHTYMISASVGGSVAFMFDNTTSDFTIGIGYSTTYSFNYDRSCNYEGKLLDLSANGSMFELVEFYENDSVVGVGFDYVSESYFNTFYVNGTKKMNGQYIHQYTVGSSSFYAYFQPATAAAGLTLILSDWDWVSVSGVENLKEGAGTPAGCVVGDMAFGYGYDTNKPGYMPYYRFEASTLYSWNWDNTIESSVNSLDASVTTLDARISAIESSLDSALSITNNILS